MQLLLAPGKFATDPQYADQLQNFHHDDRLPTPYTPPNFDYNTLTPETLEPHVHKCLRALAPRTQTGPDASRNEHWKPFYNFPQYHTSLATILHRTATGNMPDDIHKAILTTALAAKLKTNGKI